MQFASNSLKKKYTPSIVKALLIDIIGNKIITAFAVG